MDMRTSRWLLVLTLLAAACSGADSVDTAEVAAEASSDPVTTAEEPTEETTAEEEDEEDGEEMEEDEDEGSRGADGGTQIVEAGEEPLPADNNNTDNCHDFRDESRTVPRPGQGQALFLSGAATSLAGFEIDDMAILTISADGESRTYNIQGYQDDCRDSSVPTVVTGVNGRVPDAINLSTLAPAGSGDLTVRVEVKNGNGRGAASDMYLLVAPASAGTPTSTEPPAEPTEADPAPPVEEVEKLSYSEDFTDGVVGSEWAYSEGDVAQPVVATAPSGEMFLGGNSDGTEQLGSQTATLSLTAPSAGQIDVTFDFYRILSWDGNGPTGNGEDNFQVVLVQDGTEVVLVAETSFGHDAPGARGQAYPQPLGNTNPAESGQDQDDTLGYVGTTGFAPTDDTGDGIYNFNSEQEDHSVLSNIAIDAGDFEIRFIGVTNQARADESWGLDNVTVTQQ